METKKIVIKPKQSWQLIDFKELWLFRELLYFFSWRDIKVRYKQTFLGVIWVILQPIITTLVFTYFFGKLAKVPSGNLPYSLFVFIGLVFWTFFSNALTHASTSMVDNVNIVKKVYFPREILPLSSIAVSFIDFLINFSILIAISFYFHFVPSPSIFVILPITILITGLTSCGLGFFTASFNVKYRDVKYMLPFFIQIMLFLTPVIYPANSVRNSLRIFLDLNPMTGVIEVMRSAFEGTTYIDTQTLTISALSSVIIFIFGFTYFRSTERFFADII